MSYQNTKSPIENGMKTANISSTNWVTNKLNALVDLFARIVITYFMMGHCFSVEYCCGVYQDLMELMEISKLCSFSLLPEGLLYILYFTFGLVYVLVSSVSQGERKRTRFRIDLFFVDTNTKYTYDSWIQSSCLHSNIQRHKLYEAFLMLAFILDI